MATRVFEPRRAFRLPDWAVIALGIGLSGALLQILAANWLLTVAYVGAALVFAFVLRSFAGAPEVATARETAPDWSVTVAALEREDVAMAITSRDGTLVCANRRFAEWFGLDNAPPALSLDDTSAAKLRDTADEAWRSGSAEVAALVGNSGRWQARLRRAGRGQDHLIWELAPLETADLAAAVVRQLDDRLGRALATAGIQAAAVSPDGEILGANRDFAFRATGDVDAEVVGKDFVSFLTGDEYERIYYARDGTSGEDLRLVHLPIADPDAPDAVDPSLTATLFLVLEGGMHAGNTAARPEIESLLGLLPLGLAMTDREGRFLFANKAFRRAAGLEAIGEIPPFPSDLVVREDKGALADAIRRHAGGSPNSAAIPLRLLASPEESVTVSLAGVRGLGDAAVLLSLKDTTEETRLKRQVAQATKMQAVGQLAGGVAHDFNNVLTAIIGYCDLMLLRHSPGDSDYDDIQQIKANSNRAASLTRQLLAFSRQQTLRPQVLQLPDVVAEVSVLLKRLIGEKIRLDVKHDRALGAVRADPQQLEQVIINLAVNARDAMLETGERGTLAIATRKISPRDVRAMKNEILPPGHYTALVVEDTGVGIPADTIGKIFEPFFTTKEMGKGTGLGLSTVYGIVKQSGGYIFAGPRDGGGTTFTLWFPSIDASSSASEERPDERTDDSGSREGGSERGTVLLCDDEPSMRRFAAQALRLRGFEVIEAESGERALDCLGEMKVPPDVLVSDVIMGGLDGPAWTRHALERHRGLPVVFMSGYTEGALDRVGDSIPQAEFLAKPFPLDVLVSTVERALHSRNEG